MVDRYWSALEFDFRTVYGLRAMDWVAGKYDWREFYRLKEQLGQGTHYFTAYANDPDVVEEMLALEARRKMEGRPVQKHTPDGAGWTAMRDDFADLKDHLTAIRGALTGAQAGQMQWTPRPVFLAEQIRSQRGRKKARSLARMLVPHDPNTHEDI